MNRLASACLLAIVGSYFLLLARNALNLPMGDDLVVISQFLLKWDLATTVAQKWVALSENFIDHRLVFTRLAALLTRQVLGSLDFRGVMLIGNLCLVGLLWLYWQVLGVRRGPWVLLPVALILFNPIAYEGNFWAIASTNYMPVCFLALLGLYYAATSVQGSSRWRRAGLFGVGTFGAMAASFTFANGLFVWPIGLVVLLLQKRWRAAGGWLAMAAATGALYATGFSYDNHPDVLGNVLTNLPNILLSFCALVGATANPNDTMHVLTGADVPSILLGAGLTGWLLWNLYRMARQQPLLAKPGVPSAMPHQANEAFLIGATLFLLGSSAAQAAGRTFADVLPIDSRYRNFSILLLAMGYLMAVYKADFRQRFSQRAYGCWLVSATMLCVFSYTFYTPRLRSMQASLKAGLFNYQQNQTWAIYRGLSYFDFAADRLSLLIDQQAGAYYRFPTYYYPLRLSTLRQEPSLQKHAVRISQTAAGNYLSVHHTPSQPMPGQPLIWLRLGACEWLLGARQQLSLRSLLTQQTPQTNTVTAFVMLRQPTGANLPDGDYDLRIVYMRNNVPVAYSALEAYQIQLNNNVCRLIPRLAHLPVSDWPLSAADRTRQPKALSANDLLPTELVPHRHQRETEPVGPSPTRRVLSGRIFLR